MRNCPFCGTKVRAGPRRSGRKHAEPMFLVTAVGEDVEESNPAH